MIPFGEGGPKVTSQKNIKPPPKKKKKASKGKDAVKDSSIVGESQAAEEQGNDNESQADAVEKERYTPKRKIRSRSGDLISGLPKKTTGRKRTSETSPPSSGDSAMSALPPMIRVQGAQAKKRKTGDSSSAPKTTKVLGTSASVLELDEDQVAAHDVPLDDIPDIRDDSPDILKETANKVNPPSPLKATEDPDAIIITEIMKADHQKLEKKAKADQASILKRAEQAKGKLEAAQQELFGLKKHISNMTLAMFVSVLMIKAVMGRKEPVKSIKKMLSYLSMLHPQIEELKRSTAGKGALNTLSRCLDYALELKPEEVAAGYPELKDDGSEFTEDDYHRVIKESRFAATHLVAGLDLNKYQAAYDDKNKKVTPPLYEITSLAPRRPKNPFDLDVDLSIFLNDEDGFVALSKCNWKLGDLQIEGGESSRQGDRRWLESSQDVIIASKRQSDLFLIRG
ncbi:hypothetical protein ZWY2020_014282 [Hordeum vulgare]|nr:hypothetical protein ZWY2020_014282 [Hordeum vulgare]